MRNVNEDVSPRRCEERVVRRSKTGLVFEQRIKPRLFRR